MSPSYDLLWTSRGETENWNWNGTFKQIHYFGTDYEGIESKEGNCVNSLIDGTVYVHVESPNHTFSYYRDYNMGIGAEEGQYIDGRAIRFSMPNEPYIYELCTSGWAAEPTAQVLKW